MYYDEEAPLQVCCFSIYILCQLFMHQLTEVLLKHWLCCALRLNPSLTNYVMDQNEKQLFDLAFHVYIFSQTDVIRSLTLLVPSIWFSFLYCTAIASGFAFQRDH
jgi:hypothetical protein